MPRTVLPEARVSGLLGPADMFDRQMRNWKSDVRVWRENDREALTDILHEGVRLIALPMRVWIDPLAHEILVGD